ncbi:sigma-70 family RNA polymerase sigma factor [Leptospira borgpetersenii serovar Hardjo-bovis]|uniref:ECF sigma factor n=1 Tax=Leptospira borgpetersenii serovar Hardjo-bovis str. Sponselee TaxID=1303729 RepID=M6C1P2_LEPBO|nr:sigma-70 family RNA polymerase sigma factor [Leptospira borgpetersenii]ABJ80213.1 RNA polymerase sigma subunit [Leptospira borgpetersenii serovar Hardjo-bovis str. L550]AMX59679.1 DNA-directed RNA polymerase sigma-70 factor [Leptospira borgpetersenii serovar Hardjo]AMX62907.1 DNA-directed RNA polymerase sigma-70 factor [Leptospira borgpetersenii serovar Hardjo]AMX66150.1 DNA-directed RNA polymerase sigma-70 factor [Leptospira borgpetersenii serovar Hardjo]AMX69382.1 DNA-directed RNA polymer
MRENTPIVCNQEDWDCIQKVLHGDFNSFEILMNRYQGLIYSQVIKAFRNETEAEDFTQDIFLKAFESLSTFQGRSQFSTWLFVIARNEIIRRYRREHPEISGLDTLLLTESEVEKKNETSSEQETKLLKQEISEKIRSLVESLPELYRKPIMLHYFENMSYKEISQKLNLKMNTLKSYIFRGKEIMRDWLNKEENEKQE